MFQVTHPFHPLHGQQFPVLTTRHNWGEDRVYYYDPEGHLVSIQAAWTDVCAPDPFVLVSAGRSPFCLADLLELARFLSSLNTETGHGD